MQVFFFFGGGGGGASLGPKNWADCLMVNFCPILEKRDPQWKLQYLQAMQVFSPLTLYHSFDSMYAIKQNESKLFNIFCVLHRCFPIFNVKFSERPRKDGL